MTHRMELLPWLRKTRSVFGRFAVASLVPIFIGEVAYSNLENAPTFSVIEDVVAKWLPWVESASILVLLVSLAGLASTWWARDWWIERWVRTHESFVG